MFIKKHRKKNLGTSEAVFLKQKKIKLELFLKILNWGGGDKLWKKKMCATGPVFSQIVPICSQLKKMKKIISPKNMDSLLPLLIISILRSLQIN